MPRYGIHILVDYRGGVDYAVYTGGNSWRSILIPRYGTYILVGYRGGVDYPVSLYWRQLMEVYPNAKVWITYPFLFTSYCKEDQA